MKMATETLQAKSASPGFFGNVDMSGNLSAKVVFYEK